MADVNWDDFKPVTAEGPKAAVDWDQFQPVAEAPAARAPLEPMGDPMGSGFDATANVGDPDAKPVGPGAAVAFGERMRDSAFSGIDAANANLKTLNFVGQTSEQRKALDKLAALQAAGQGDSPEAQGLKITLKAYGARMPGMASSAAEAQHDAKLGAEVTRIPSVDKVSGAKTLDEAWEAFKEDPYEIIGNVTAQSLPQMVPGIVTAIMAGPGAGAAMTGASSFITEAGSSLSDFARDNGVDTSDAKALERFFSDTDNLREAMSYAGTRAGIIGSLDAASGGVAGKTIAPTLKTMASPVKRGIIRQAVNMPAQMAVQAGLGAGGEAGGQLATKGEIDQPGQVLLEAAGELGGAPAEVFAFSKEARDTIKGKNHEPVEPTITPNNTDMYGAWQTGQKTPPDVASIFKTGSVEEAAAAAAKVVDSGSLDKAVDAELDTLRPLRPGTEGAPDVSAADGVPGDAAGADRLGGDDAGAGVVPPVGDRAPDGRTVDTEGAGAGAADVAAPVGARGPLELTTRPYNEGERAQAESAIAALNDGLERSNADRIASKAGAPDQPAQVLQGAPTADMVRARQVARLFGLPVTFIEPHAGFNGVHIEGQIFVSPQEKHPVLAVMGHEVLHGIMGKLGPDEAQALRDRIAPFLKPEAVDRREAVEPHRGREHAVEEAVADLNGSMWMDPKFWQAVREHDPHAFRQLAYRFMELAATVTQKLGKVSRFQAEKFTTDVDAVRRILAEQHAMLAKEEGVERPSPNEKVEMGLRKGSQEEQRDAQKPAAKSRDASARPKFQITPEQAKETNVKVALPDDPIFKEAVANTPGAEITPDGLKIDLVRFQKPEQEAGQAVRTGVFYLPEGSKNQRHYRGTTSYGGSEKFAGPTLLRKPLFVKGATGGKAPEVAYETVMGKGSFKELERDVRSVSTDSLKRIDPQSFRDAVKNFLADHGGDPRMAPEIIEYSREGNRLRYALQEHVIAHAVRDAGYDSVVGYSRGKEGPRISEVFDVRETTYPSHIIESSVHPKFTDEPSFDRDTEPFYSAPSEHLPGGNEAMFSRKGAEDAAPANLAPEDARAAGNLRREIKMLETLKGCLG